MMRKMVVFSIALFLSFVFCSVSEAKSLKKGEVYRLNGQESMEVISSSELEITEGSRTFVAEYEFKGDKLRVVANVLGTKMVKYYLLTEQGLKEEGTGNVYYFKAGLEEDRRVEEKRKAAAMAKEERQRAEEKKMGKAIIEELKKSMVLVKGGCFQMGDAFGYGGSGEKPVHEVCVDDFYIGKYEVTQKEWMAVMGNNPSDFKGCDYCPVEQVSWNDIQEFINKLNQKTGKKYRLPTEAEWEYAARSGGKNEIYAGGNDIDSVAWYNDNSGSKTHTVGQKQPNGLGIYDMSGNVWEWVADWYGDKYYSGSPKNNPKGPDSGVDRVLRGGSWYGYVGGTRAADRYRKTPDLRDNYLGFRVAVSSARQ